ncbi:MAG TPA: hypothetical protein VF062_15690 [Candidatus Limnocylindrales bacterium]
MEPLTRPHGLGTSATCIDRSKPDRSEDDGFWPPRFHIPFESRMNPQVERVRAHSLAWARANDLVTTDEAERRLDAARFDRLTARFFPDATGAALDLFGDWDLWYFLFDDSFDGPIGRNPAAAEQVLEPMIATAAGDPARMNLDAPPMRAFAELCCRTGLGRSVQWRPRLALDFAGYLDSYRWEAAYRCSGTQPDVETCIAMRRESIGVRSTLTCGETVDRFELAVPIFRSAAIQRMRDITADVVALVNDAFSLAKDLHHADTNNVAVILMRTKGWSVGRAIHHLEDLVSGLVSEFQDLEHAAKALPATMFLPRERPNVERYLAMMRRLMRGNLDWSAETSRYHDHVPDTWRHGKNNHILL